VVGGPRLVVRGIDPQPRPPAEGLNTRSRSLPEGTILARFDPNEL